MSTIIAIGGEEIGVLDSNGKRVTLATESVHKEIISRTGKDNPKILYIPTAKDDREDYIEGFISLYQHLGCKNISVLKLIHNKPNHKEIETAIMSADAIYVNGGNTHRMMRIWKKRGVIPLLKKAHRNGTIMAGHSAGAICWFSGGNSDSFNKRRPFRATAMGIIEALLCPHYDTEKFRQASLKKMMRKTPRLVAIALDECAAIEIHDKSYMVLPTVQSAKTRRTYWKNNKYYIEEIMPSNNFRDLDELLVKPI